MFKREGSDVYTEVSIPVTTAMLGGSVAAPTVDGDVDLRIPAGLQPGDTIALRKKGIPKMKDSKTRGDAYFTVDVNIPK